MAQETALVSPEALGFLSAVGVFVILMLILFLYVNKKLCFENVGDLSCMDEYRTGKDLKDNDYQDGDPRGSSSESEDDVVGKYKEAVSRSQGGRATDSRHQKGYMWETRHKYSPLSAEYDGYSSEASAEDEADIWQVSGMYSEGSETSFPQDTTDETFSGRESICTESEQGQDYSTFSGKYSGTMTRTLSREGAATTVQTSKDNECYSWQNRLRTLQ